MISIATFKKSKTCSVLQNTLALEGIESTLLDKVAFNSATQVAIPSVSILINEVDEERVVEIMEEIGPKLLD